MAYYKSENYPAATEPQTCVAKYIPEEGYLELWIKHQPIDANSQIASRGIADYVKIKLNIPYQACWFGGIAHMHMSNMFITIAAVAAKRTNGRPVKLFYDESALLLSWR
jgi:CO/xanthine dehydrogenase Mo-binding subunit